MNLSYTQDQSVITKSNSNNQLQREPDIESLNHFQSIKSKESSKIRALFEGSLLKYQSNNKTDFDFSISELNPSYLKPGLCDNSFEKSDNKKPNLNYLAVDTSIDNITTIYPNQKTTTLNTNKSSESFFEFGSLLKSQPNNKITPLISQSNKNNFRKEKSNGRIHY